jgi:hypothetical protein
MARIRTIKPDFFTSEDICALSPRARLLYIGLWCEADRQGRLQWSPKTLKRRYLPDDDCDIDAVCQELLMRDLVRLYGEDDLAFIPTFLEHQKPNPREAESTLPAPDVHPSNLDLHASNPDLHPQVGKERKGREGKGMDAASRRVSHATEIPDDFQPSEEDRAVVKKARPDLTPALIADETVRFINHAKANARTAMHWGPNWQNWMFKAAAPTAAPVSKFGKPDPQALPPTEPWEQRMQGWNEKRQWVPQVWGPRPGEPGCRAPKHLIGGTA